MQMEVVILKNNYIYEIFWKYKIQKNFKRIFSIYFEIMFYLYILVVHASFSFDIIIYLYDFSVLEIYINVTVNSNSVRNYCPCKKMK